MLLSRHSVGTYLETSSHATCQGTFSNSHLSSLSHYGLVLAQSEISVRKLISLKNKVCHLARQNTTPTPNCVPSDNVSQSATVSI